MAARAVAFDLDGTLVDSLGDLAGAVNEVLGSLGAEPHPESQIRTMIGGGARRLLERAIAERPSVAFEDAYARFYDIYAAQLTRTTRLFPGMREVLERLRKLGLPCVVATNKPAYFTDRIIEALGLEGAGIAGWASADEVPEKKPSPEVVRLALERAGLGHLPGRSVPYVGDMPVDVKTARALGGASVIVSWGFDPDGARAAGPDHWVDSTPALLDALRRLQTPAQA